ncbi:type II secretion system protein [Oceanobacillus halotolerans]|uniref:type II secretion system protein n=1 Tax=Oceanobacillus halotolerans TaxID=2663380 RepID=UPI0013DD2486|nr:type II secretion system protein [Oceanobacillus halotolerans]
MYNRFRKLNSQGFTLIEIIASIAILGMVVAIFLPIFPQIMNWTNNTDDELTASNLLTQVSSEASDVVGNVDDLGVQACPEDNSLSYDIGETFSKAYDDYTAQLTVICKETGVDLFRTTIQIFSEDQLISQSYTYISGDI